MYYIEKRKGVTKIHLNRSIKFRIKERYRIVKEKRDEKEESYQSDYKGERNQRRLSYIVNHICPVWFRRIYRPGNEFDRKGIDFFLDIYLSNYSVKTIRIQVKSSVLLAKEFIAYGAIRCLEKVLVIVVNDNLEDEEIIHNLETRIRRTIKGNLYLLGDQID